MHYKALIVFFSSLDVRRSMPNLNKLRGAKNGTVVANPQYGLSQPRYHNSDSRLQPPGSRLQGDFYNRKWPLDWLFIYLLGPSQLAAPNRTLRAPSSGLVRPSKISSGLRPPGGQERKLSGIARPAGGIPRPGQSRLQAPGQFQRFVLFQHFLLLRIVIWQHSIVTSWCCPFGRKLKAQETFLYFGSTKKILQFSIFHSESNFNKQSKVLRRFPPDF